MKRILTAMLLAAPGWLWAAPPVGVGSTAGLWKIDGDVHGRPVNMMCQLTQTGQKLAGTCSSATDGAAAHTIDGTVKGQKIQFHLQTAFGGSSITLIVSGKLNQDHTRVSGDLDVEPIGVGGRFEGERTMDAATATAPPAAPSQEQAPPIPPAASEPTAAPPDATGTWKVAADFEGNAVSLTCAVTQKQQALSGVCTGDDGKANPLTGEVSDRGLKWRFEAEYQGQPIRVTMTATLAPDGASMAGEIAVAPLNAAGTFTAARETTLPAPSGEKPPAP